MRTRENPTEVVHSFSSIPSEQIPNEPLDIDEYRKRIGLYPAQCELSDEVDEALNDYSDLREELLEATVPALEAENQVFDLYGKYGFGHFSESGRDGKWSFNAGISIDVDSTALDSLGNHQEAGKHFEFLSAPARYGQTKFSIGAIKAEAKLRDYLRSPEIIDRIREVEDPTSRAILADLVLTRHPFAGLNLGDSFQSIRTEHVMAELKKEPDSNIVPSPFIAFRFGLNEPSVGDSSFNRNTFSDIIIADSFEIRGAGDESPWNIGLFAVGAVAITRFDETKWATKDIPRVRRAVTSGNWTRRSTSRYSKVGGPSQSDSFFIGPTVGGINSLIYADDNYPSFNPMLSSKIIKGIINGPNNLENKIEIAKSEVQHSRKYDYSGRGQITPSIVIGNLAGISPESLVESLDASIVGQHVVKALAKTVKSFSKLTK